MAMRHHRYLILAGLTAVLPFTICAHENNQATSLSAQISRADAQFFTAFNQCDIATMAKMFSPQLEFYHDTGGVSDYAQTMNATESLCQRVPDLTRTLQPETMQVYPVKDFGAIQQGRHTFCHKENGKDDCGTFGFTHIWQQTEEGWLLHRVLSYGH